MADNLTVRVGEGAAPSGGTDTSGKKSKLDQQAQQLGSVIKQRTGRSVDDDMLRALVLRKQAKAERTEQSERSQKDYAKNTAGEKLQTKVSDDLGALIGRARETNTPDGLNRHQRQLVTSDPNAPTILPPATHPPISAEAASHVLEKIFSFLKPASAEAVPLTIENYSETLVPRPATKPGEKTFRDGEQQSGGQARQGAQQLRSEAPNDRPVTGGGTGDAVAQPTTGAEQPQRPVTGEQPQQPVTGEHPQRPTDGGERPVGGDSGHPALGEGGRPSLGGEPAPAGGRPTIGGEPAPEAGRPVAHPPADEPGMPRPPLGNTIHLEKQRLPGNLSPAPPSHSGASPLGRGVMSGASASDASTSTPLGQTGQPRAGQTTAGGKAAPASGARLRAGPAPIGREDSKGNDAPIGRVTREGADAQQLEGRASALTGEQPTDRPVGGRVLTEEPEQAPGQTVTGHGEHPQRPVTDDGRPVVAKETAPKLPHQPPSNTVHLEKKRLPGQQAPVPPSQSGATTLGRGVMAGAHATDGSTASPLGQTTVAKPSPGTTTKPPIGGRPGPGSGSTVGGPVGGRPRSLATLGNERSGSGLTMSLRGGSTTRLRATDGTTDAVPFVNTGGGFDTTTSWDGMHFNWEAFFIKFMFKFQEDENEARRMMKELRNAMHKLAQEGIKAKIALEKMNQAFERAEKAFEVGAALKSTMEAMASAGPQSQPAGREPGPPSDPNGTRPTPGAGQNPTQDDGTGTVNPQSSATGNPPAGATDLTAQPGGPPQQAQPAGQNPAPGEQPRPGQPTPQGTQPGAAQTRNPDGSPRNPRTAEDRDGDGKKDKGLPGGGLVGNVAEQLRRDLEKINGEFIAAAQRGGSEVDSRIRSNYMQAQGLINQMTQLLAMSRSK